MYVISNMYIYFMYVTYNVSTKDFEGTFGRPPMSFLQRTLMRILGMTVVLVGLLSLLPLTLDQTMAVGDGANDIPMLGGAGTGVAFHAKPAVAATARFTVDHGDLTALLYLQGYQDSDFVTD